MIEEYTMVCVLYFMFFSALVFVFTRLLTKDVRLEEVSFETFSMSALIFLFLVAAARAM